MSEENLSVEITQGQNAQLAIEQMRITPGLRGTPSPGPEAESNTLVTAAASAPSVSVAGSCIEVPLSNPSTSLWALFQPDTTAQVNEACAKMAAELGGKGITTTSQEMAQNLIREHNSYTLRLQVHESRLNQQIDVLVAEQRGDEAEMQQRLSEEERLLEDSLKAQYGQMAVLPTVNKSREPVTRLAITKPTTAATQSRSHTTTTDESFSSPSGSEEFGEGEEGDCRKVIGFWKTKHSELQETFDLQEVELADMNNRLNDIRYLQNTTDQDLFKTHRLIGLLREREAAERLKADAYSRLLHDLVVPGGGRELGLGYDDDEAHLIHTPRGTTPVSSEFRVSGINPTLSAIEEALVKSELEGVNRVAKEIEKLRQVLLSAQERRTTRLDELRARLDTTSQKLGNRQGFNLEETLAEVMELRDEVRIITEEKVKLQNSSQEAESTNNALLTQFTLEISVLEEEKASAKQQASTIGRELLEQLRECKVESIRTMYRSCGDVDSTFQRLKVEQHINVLQGSLHKAQAQATRMLHEVNATEDNVRMNSEFLAKC